MAFPIPQVLTYTYHAEGILNGGGRQDKGRKLRGLCQAPELSLNLSLLLAVVLASLS